MTSGKHIQKLKSWLLPTLLLLMLIATVVLWLWIPSLIISRLSDYTHSKTEGKYTLEIEDIRRSLFPLSLTVKGVALEPMAYNLTDQEFNPKEILYHFNAREIQLEGLDLVQLFREKILKGKKIKVIRPEIKLAGEELLQIDTLSFSSDFISNLWPLFGYVNKVDIKKIELEEANFGFYSAAGDSNFISRAEKLAIDVHGFVASREMAETQEQFFETEDVFLRMNNFRYDMGDSLHMLTIDTLFYSLKTTDIKVNGFNLHPYYFNPEENLFEIVVPEVYVKSRSIAHFALSDSLKIGYLEFSSPKIKFFHKNQPRQIAIEAIDEFDMYSLIQGQFLKMEVDSFFLQGAHVEIFSQPDVGSYRQQFQSVDVILHGFELDSTSFLNREKLLHADNLEMHVKGYHLKLKDNEHHFRAGSLFASSFNSQISARDIRIYPEEPGNTGLRNEINIECEELKIEDADFRDLYHRRILPTSKIEVIEPNVRLRYNLEKDKKEKQEGTGLLFDLVTDYLQGVYANTVRVATGHLNIQNSYREVLKGYFETNIDFSLTEFRLDSASVQESSNFFYATNFDLLFTDYNMRLTDDFHKLEVDTLSISSHHDHVEILNIRLQPVLEHITPEVMRSTGHSELFRIFVPQVSLHSVNLRNAFFNQRIQITDFSISNPEIYFENFGRDRDNNDKQELSEIYQLIFSYIEDIDIQQFRINSGLLTWINHTRKGRTTTFDNEFSASLRNFRLNEAELEKKRLLFSDNFDLTIKDQEFELSDDVHVLKGSEITFSSSESRINVKDALLFPLITSEKYLDLATTWQVAIPEINIDGFDFHKAYFSQEPEIQNLVLIKPRFQVYIQPDKVKGLDLKAYSIPMPSFIESLRIGEMKIKGGEAVTYRKEGMRHHAMANFFFNLSVPGLMFQDNDQHQLQVSSNNIDLSVSDFRIPVDDIHNLHVESIDFNRESQTIKVSDLRLLPFISDTTYNMFTIHAPDIRFREFDFDAALNENNFIFAGIEAIAPDIAISVNREMEEDSPEFLETLDLYPYVEHLVNSIQVKNLDVNNAHLKLSWLKNQIINNNLSLSFEEILLSDNQPPHNLLNSRAFTISTSGISATSKDNLYEFKTDSLIYQSTINSVIFKNLGIVPLADKRSFHLKTGFQTDVVEAVIDYVEFRGIKERRWLQDNILDARAVVIGPANIDIFRDKRFPFNDNQRPGWPQDLIQNLKQPFVFDSVLLLPSKIRYSELLGIFDEPGTIEFTELTLKGSRLSNMQENMKKNGLFTLNAEARLQDKALLSAQFVFNLNSPDYAHTVKGSLGPMPLQPLNSMIMKSAPVAVETGQLKRLDFDIVFNEDSAKGEMVMEYDNLKVAILDYSGDDIQKAWLTSFLANSLKVNSQNSGGENPKPTEIEFERDKRRSVLHLWWKSLYSGVVKVIGI